jgi:cytochrome c peroxidase
MAGLRTRLQTKSIRDGLLTLSNVLFFLVIAACNSSNNDNTADTDVDALLRMVKTVGMTGDPSANRKIPSLNDPLVQLGKKLFFTKGLGGDSDTACVTCHHPALGGGDNLSLSVGVGAEVPDLLGPGRLHDSGSPHYDGGPTVPRNAPTTFNVALWDRALFHDGRVESLGKTTGANGNDGFGIRTPDSEFGVADPNAGTTLPEAQARFPVTSPEEMRGFVFEAGNSNEAVRASLSDKLTAAGGWAAEFSFAFGDPGITYSRLAKAIGEYERSQVFVDTPWKAFIEGDTRAISESAKRGAMLFFLGIEAGGANCASCHSGDFFTDEHYHVLATPQIGRGKGDDNGTLTNDDFGRFRESKQSEDMYKFRTPTLLNVEVTGPWGHAGSYTTLAGIVRHMLNPAEAIANYDFSQLDSNIQAADMLTNTQFALEQLEANRRNHVEGVHHNVSYTETDVKDLVEFLKTLTDPCVKNRDCIASWIPDNSDENPDGLRVDAIDNAGALL